MKPFEILDHPADAGFIARGRSLEELFCHAALGMWSLVTDEAVESFPRDPAASRRMAFEAKGEEELLFAWLRELLFYFSTQPLILPHHRFEPLEPGRLACESSGFRFDPARHRCGMEIKAVTRHQFSVKCLPSGIREARVIFDV